MLSPIFPENNIPIILASDNGYVNYLAVMLRSIVLNASDRYNYDIIVLENNITEKNKNTIVAENVQNNVSIRFIDANSVMKEHYNGLYTCAHFTEIAYARLFIPKIFNKYDKALYLDCDMVVLTDVAELYFTDIGDNVFAATIDYGVCSDAKLVAYANKILKMKLPDKYKQSGVLIVNVKKLITENYFDKFMDKLRQIKSPKLVDQCIINATCEDKIYELNQDWNVTCHALFGGNISNEEYRSKIREIKIVHYSGKIKPDNYKQCDITDHFWKYAEQTKFYEAISRNYINNFIKKQVQACLYSYIEYKKFQLYVIITFGLVKKIVYYKKYYKKQFINGVINWSECT